jgi:hypothetical protein
VPAVGPLLATCTMVDEDTSSVVAEYLGDLFHAVWRGTSEDVRLGDRLIQ